MTLLDMTQDTLMPAYSRGWFESPPREPLHLLVKIWKGRGENIQHTDYSVQNNPLLASVCLIFNMLFDLCKKLKSPIIRF